jgi:hypothetical protein
MRLPIGMAFIALLIGSFAAAAFRTAVTSTRGS